MLFEQGPAETTNYMILGFAFIFGPILIHIWSLYRRTNRLKKDLEMLEEMDK
jgi:hypothetical protein